MKIGASTVTAIFLGTTAITSAYLGATQVFGGGSAFSPSSLFASSEPGVWYDPSDLTTLFQDTAGTTPVTTPSQTVALLLDKSKGLVLGAELVTNGDFASGSTGWTLQGTATISGGVAVINSSSAADKLVTAAAVLPAGKFARVEFDLVVTSGGITHQDTIGGNTVGFTTSGRKSLIAYSASAVGIQFFRNAMAGSFNGTIDNISVRELPGNHATQATAASRPTFGVVPLGGRRNLLTFSEDFRSTAQAGSTRPWTVDNSGATNPTVTADFGTAPDGTTTADRIQLNKTGGTFSRVQQILSGLPARIYTFSVWFKNNAGGTVNVGIRVEGTAANCAVTSTWQRFSVTLSSAGTSASAQVMLFDSIAGNDETADILAWGAQVDASSTATDYQKVTTQYEVTEAGVQSLPCLSFDGVDDFLVTPTITPGADKVQFFSGVGKLSDAATSILAEHSVSAASNAGTFIVTAPNNITSSGNYGMYSRGSTAPAAAANSAITLAPVINVLTGIGDISGDVQRIRLNGAGEVTNTNDQGTGNYLAHPTYIGRRGGTSLPFNGNLYSLIVRFGANLSAGQITDTETWVAGKTGVTL